MLENYRFSVALSPTKNHFKTDVCVAGMCILIWTMRTAYVVSCFFFIRYFNILQCSPISYLISQYIQCVNDNLLLEDSQ